MALARTLIQKLVVIGDDTQFLIHDFGLKSGELLSHIDMLERWNPRLRSLYEFILRSIASNLLLDKRELEAPRDDYRWAHFFRYEYWFKIRLIDGLKMATHADTGAAQNVVSNEFVGARELKRGLSGTIDGLKVSALADTGAAQNVVSGNFARARKLDVAGSPSSFRQGNSKLAHSLGTSKN